MQKPDFTKSFEKYGIVWRAGLRVITRCGLAGVDKMEYESGLSGTVWEVLDEDVMLVCLDDPECAIKLVKAEPKDLIAEAFLPAKTKVRSHELELSLGDRRKVIPNKEFGEVVKHDAQTNTYMVRFTAMKLLANVPTHVVQPLPRKLSMMERISAAAVRLGKGRARDAPLPNSSAGTLATMDSSATALPSPAHADPCSVSVSSFLSGLGSDSDEDPGLSASISNLMKQPTYSNISGSPRALKTSMRGRSGSVKSMNTSVSWGDYEDQDRGPVPRSPADNSHESVVSSEDVAASPRRMRLSAPLADRSRSKSPTPSPAGASLVSLASKGSRRSPRQAVNMALAGSPRC
eukprot:TRINITY_DN1201_c0_g2_i3.p1 TRINITY_DN1201_c0_g2~~TRINITY_DN1201_c0_g2_i3.p1  ORF type:complete len:347 (+),score=110.32 TRINITY_DN1201_c0_g2_i3:61-1101(+)